MISKRRALQISLGVLLTVLCCSCHTAAPARDRTAENKFLRIILWAWERPEDLEFLNPQRFGVAFLAQTLVLQGDEVLFCPRHQPLKVLFRRCGSEREFYRRLLQDLRKQLRDNVALSLTALAAFCVGDRRLEDLPVDEAAPMIFRMGADNDSIKNLLANGQDFREPLCRRSYGIAIDEPLKMELDRSRRLYFFNSRSWTESDVRPFQ